MTPIDLEADERGDFVKRIGLGETLRRGLAISPELRKGLGVTIALAAVAASARATIPYLTQRVTDEGLLAPGGVDLTIVHQLVAGGAVVVLISMLVEWRVRRRMVIAAEAGLATLRKRAFDNVHKLSVLTQNSEQRGRYVSRVTGDVDTMRDLMQWTGAGMMVAAFESTVVLIVMAVYSWQLALVVVGCYVPLLAVTMRFQPAISRAFGDIRARMADLLGRTSEQLVGVATIRSYGVQARMRQRLRDEIDGIAKRERRAAWLASSSFSMTAFGQSFATGAALVVGTALGVRGTLSVGTVAAFALLVYMFSSPLMWIVEMLAEMQRALVGWQRVIELVDAEATVADPDSPVALPAGTLDLTVEGIRLTYEGDEEVLKGITFTVPAGKRLAIVGQTGSGKTSLARLMSRFFDPTEGRIALSGIDVRDVAFAELRDRLAVVPQEGFLFEGTISDNLRYSLPAASDEDLHAAGQEAFEALGLHTWLEGTSHGLDTAVGTRGELLSAGERQLVSIARAYLTDPDVLILDEATSAVDPSTEVRISRALEALMKGRTAVVIAHRLSTAERADFVAVMDNGELVEFGSHTELVRAGGTYERLHRAWVSQTRD
ncbi:ABC transporter ATP-binding protein [Demequina lutea]|uniref:ABC-type multidrug transport system fused ATPase/permease subunit n=1 Tax=Demequina lutea TaxID=431489 RepID=A0A7Y9ZBJ8_9MICO|nr:ABC transporter ATP-binding protein [Demequina lutea]NYI41568.1 ABC-type multidrug transport system fused ATPase/permease subunit [Demequina lutea]